MKHNGIWKWMLSFLLVLSVMPVMLVSAWAADETAGYTLGRSGSGTCGTNLTWTLDTDGKLTISGAGAMENYSGSSSSPWKGEDVKSVSIGSDVTSIGNYAFSYCEVLESITVPDSVTSIGTAAFSGCRRLENVHIPDGVISIEERTFSNCISLKDITIPDSVTSIGYGAFSFCLSLKSMVIPDSVTNIAINAFSNCGLESITISSRVESIGTSTFSNCASLTSITIPNSVKSIGEIAFLNCSKLSDVYYSGTKAQWNEVSIHETGNDKLKSATIHCSDGDINAKPSGSTDPSGPSDSTDPSNPSNPSNPGDPSGPSNPSNPSDPSGPSDLFLDINRDLTVPVGKRLNILAGVPMHVSDGAVFRIDGVLHHAGDEWINRSTVEITGSVTTGVGIFCRGGSTLSMTGGTLTSSCDAGAVVQAVGGRLSLTGGTITNTGSGPALHLSEAPASWDVTATLRSLSENPVLVNGVPYVPDGYRVVQQGGYYTLIRA